MQILVGMIGIVSLYLMMMSLAVLIIVKNWIFSDLLLLMIPPVQNNGEKIGGGDRMEVVNCAVKIMLWSG